MALTIDEMKSFIPQNLKLMPENIQKEIQVNIHLSHCAGNIASITKIRFPLNTEGATQLELFTKIIDLAAQYMLRYSDKYTEFIAEKISQKLSIDEQTILKILEKFSFCDAATDESFAIPIGYQIELHNGLGNMVRYHYVPLN